MGAGGRREEGGAGGGVGSMNRCSADPRTAAPREDRQPSCPASDDGSVFAQAPTPDGNCVHLKTEENPASPDDLDDGDSEMGDEGVAAALLERLAKGGMDTDSAPGSCWDESLNQIMPTLPALNVHVDHMNVFVREDRLTYQRTPAHPKGAVLRDM